MLTGLKVSSLACKCVFYRSEHNSFVGRKSFLKTCGRTNLLITTKFNQNYVNHVKTNLILEN